MNYLYKFLFFVSLFAGSIAAPTGQPQYDIDIVTKITQLLSGNGYTHIISARGPTITIDIGKPPATVTLTRTLADGSEGYTSTTPGKGETPTCTIVYGKPGAEWFDAL